jgi:1-acyl-sn-glycerol-3-phosphate acyltransferase
VIYALLKYVVLGPILRLVFRPQIEGLDFVPATGAAILASNHLSFSDSIFMPLMVRRKVTFVAKAEYFSGTGIKGRLIKAFFVGTGTIPIDRSGGRAAQAAMDTGLAVLRSGELFGIYPEGTRSPDGRLYRGKTGTMRVALATGAPVVPVVVRGTDAVNPVGSRWWHFGKVHLIVCEPLDLSRYGPRRIDQQVVREATDELMQALRARSGQEYVDSYAVTRGVVRA